MSRLFNPLPADDRSTEEQLRDLGVEVIRPKAKPTPKVTGVKWAQRRKVTRRIKRRQQKPRITFCKYYFKGCFIKFNTFVVTRCCSFNFNYFSTFIPCNIYYF